MSIRFATGTTIRTATLCLIMVLNSCNSFAMKSDASSQPTSAPTHAKSAQNNFPYNSITSAATPMSAKYDGTNLLIAACDDTGTEMCYWFKKCMNNDLFTFYRVGYRNVNRSVSSADGITADKSITWLNRTESDNIGPVSTDSYADFVGGNHRWCKKDKNGKPGKGERTTVHTATTDAVTIMADSRRLSPGAAETQCTSVTVNVANTLYNPLVEPKRGAKRLSSPLISESVTYLVTGNSIDVNVTHTYNKPTTVRRYYGMQSMFVGETKIETPDGKYLTGATPETAKSFNKAAYPLFNRFIEFNDDGWCQSSWLETAGLGQHAMIAGDSPIYIRGENKTYHVLLFGSNVKAGTPYRWHGVYTWTKPIANNGSILAYTGYINGRQALFISTKRSMSNHRITVPGEWKEIKIIERTGDITLNASGNAIAISASEPSSIIITQKQ